MMQRNFKILLYLALTLVFISCERLGQNESLPEIPVYIPDQEFLSELIDDKIDTNCDSIISYREAEVVTFLNLSNYFGPDICDLTGIEAFKNLEVLVCRCNNIDELNLSENTRLKEIYAYDNDLQTLDISGCKDLVLLHVGYDGVCNKNRLTTLDLSNNHKLITLDCSFNLLHELDVSNNPHLESLNCSSNQIVEIDLSHNISLSELEIWSNQLTSLDISNCNSLSVLNFAVNHLTEIRLENNPLLVKLNASKNLLATLDVSKNPALKILIVNDMPSLQCICVESLLQSPGIMNIYSTDNTHFQLTTDCI